MRKILGLYANWRNDVLFVLLAMTLVMICAEADNVWAFAMSKLAAVMLSVLTVMLFRYWDGKGKLKDLEDYINFEL